MPHTVPSYYKLEDHREGEKTRGDGPRARERARECVTISAAGRALEKRGEGCSTRAGGSHTAMAHIDAINREPANAVERSERARERARAREREGQKKTERRSRQRQPDREIEEGRVSRRKRKREKETEAERQKRKRKRQRHRDTETGREKQRHRDTDRERDSERDRATETETGTQRDRETDSETETHSPGALKSEQPKIAVVGMPLLNPRVLSLRLRRKCTKRNMRSQPVDPCDFTLLTHTIKNTKRLRDKQDCISLLPVTAGSSMSLGPGPLFRVPQRELPEQHDTSLCPSLHSHSFFSVSLPLVLAQLYSRAVTSVVVFVRCRCLQVEVQTEPLSTFSS
eukprot:3691007-Rhodomonas_salina.1